MPERSSVGLEIGAQTKPFRVETDDSKPFRIAILGDFTGRANRRLTGGAPAARPIAIDRDNLDAVLAKLAPALELTPEDGAPAIAVSFASLDDFHPDSLFQRLPLFRKLRELRKQLRDPATFRAAAASLTGSRRPQAASAATTSPAAAPKPDLSALAAGNLLERMLEEPAAPEAPRRAAQPGDLQDFLNRIVAGSLVPGKDPEQDELVARTDSAISEQMRALLHHPDFAALEAAWRALDFLTRRLETGVDLKVYLFDISRQELIDDLNGAADLRNTAFYRHVVREAEAGKPWALIAGNYAFGAVAEDIEALARIAMIAQQGGAPFLAAAVSQVLGCPTLEGIPEPREWRVDPEAAQYWQALRELPEAASLGLLLPRFLLRLPYGENTSATETFPFEEMSGTSAHTDYLWGNPAICAVCLLGETFSEEGWRMRPGTRREIGRLPLYIYKKDGEAMTLACAEAWLSDRAAEAILNRGIMPLVSARDGDRVLLLRFQSVANPPKALAGRW